MKQKTKNYWSDIFWGIVCLVIAEVSFGLLITCDALVIEWFGMIVGIMVGIHGFFTTWEGFEKRYEAKK